MCKKDRTQIPSKNIIINKLVNGMKFSVIISVNWDSKKNYIYSYFITSKGILYDLTKYTYIKIKLKYKKASVI